ncbi:DUF4097 family beta strand repeat-containing protein [Paractinoplanes rishiriensis]|uniref:DUF4097 domain-containing protein n=1 Tax=Paractinoplanes rishiriensis TaxID=1050105 RepID=A0A919JUP2_9ACTN|nr:DUF4097 family beta strand repeat-containing protein [Actinoplanes rishiriensis]GIE95113.1 hypothetical protein Ari01nite_25780 [Actinoplanes rishiriensis]
MYEFERAAPVTVVLRALSGSVDITAEDRDGIEVEVAAPGGGDASQTQVVLEGDSLVIRAPAGRRSPRLRIVARVPAGSSVAGESASADVRLAGRFADVQLGVASAAVNLAEATGNVRLDAASGDLTVGRVGGALHLKSASGELHAGDVTGDVTVETASGRIRLDAVGGSLRAGSASGTIEVGRLRRGQASVRTVSGDVQVGVAAGSALWMDLNTVSGRSTTDLTAQGDVPPADGPVELELRVRTVSGHIRIHRAAPAGVADDRAVA